MGGTQSTHTNWAGFRPVYYSLNFQKIVSLPLTEVPRFNDAEEEVPTTIDDALFKTEVHRSNDAEEEVPTTIGDALYKLGERQIETATSAWDFPKGKFDHGVDHAVTIQTDAGPLKLRGVQFNCDVLAMLLNFRKEHIDPFDTAWFFYDEDSVTDDPHDRYSSFFVVHRDKIIRERFSFSDRSGSGFDPTIFTVDDSEPIWSHDLGWRDGRIRLWYRRFYTETRTGQLMVLRSDEPELYHYPEGRRTGADLRRSESTDSDASASKSTGATGGAVLVETAGIEKWLERIHFVLWVLVVLAIIQFLLRWL